MAHATRVSLGMNGAASAIDGGLSRDWGALELKGNTVYLSAPHSRESVFPAATYGDVSCPALLPLHVFSGSIRTHAASLKRMKSRNRPSVHPAMDEHSPTAAGAAADSGAQPANELVGGSVQGDTGDDAPGSREHVSSAEISAETGGAEAKGCAGEARSSAADAALSVMETPAEVMWTRLLKFRH